MSSIIFLGVPFILLVISIYSIYKAFVTKKWSYLLIGCSAIGIGIYLVYWLGVSLDTM